MLSKTWSLKENTSKLNCIKIKNFAFVKDPLKRVKQTNKKHDTDQEEVFIKPYIWQKTDILNI